MAKKTYTVTYIPQDWDCTVEIEDEVNGVATLDLIKQMVEFWTDWESLLDDNDGDYTRAFLQQLARQAFLICVGENYNTYGIVEEFNDLEGWCKMDGSQGIKITNTDDFDAAYSDFHIKQKP